MKKQSSSYCLDATDGRGTALLCPYKLSEPLYACLLAQNTKTNTRFTEMRKQYAFLLAESTEMRKQSSILRKQYAFLLAESTKMSKESSILKLEI